MSKVDFEEIIAVSGEESPYAVTDYGIILNKDCLIGLRQIKDKSIQLIVTSPPYADRRKKTYGGISEKEYNKWFKPIAEEIYRVLKDDGSFLLNIKEHTVNGERSLYVFDLVLMLCREVGFKLIDTFCWTKNAFPGGYRNRFKNAWEPIYHFAKQTDIAFYPDNVAVPIKEESKKRFYRKFCGYSQNGSGFQCTVSERMRKREFAYPSNHLAINNVVNQYSDNKWHPAVFPLELPAFFIKAMTKEGDWVLDPFMGSARTAIAAIQNGRSYVEFEINYDYFLKANDSICRLTSLESVVYNLLNCPQRVESR